MNEKRFALLLPNAIINDTIVRKSYYLSEKEDVEKLVGVLNEQDKEIGLLRLELDTHRHPLWSTREAERKLSEVTNNLANEVKKNGLLNEKINQLRFALRTEQALARVEKDNRPFLSKEEFLKELENE